MEYILVEYTQFSIMYSHIPFLGKGYCPGLGGGGVLLGPNFILDPSVKDPTYLYVAAI